MTYPTSSSASDVWSLRDVYKAEAGGEWPALPVVPDPNFANVSLLINADGLADGSTAFVDESNNSHTITAYGDAQVDTAIKKYGTGSMQFNETGGYLQIPYSNAFSFGSGDFTIEFWCRDISSGALVSLGQSAGGSNSNFSVFTTSNNVQFYTGTGSAWYLRGSAIPLSEGVWHHIALVVNAGTFKGYKDGEEITTASVPTIPTTTTHDLTVGSQYTSSGTLPNSGQELIGYIDDLRITKGVARYTANFTPPNKTFPTL